MGFRRPFLRYIATYVIVLLVPVLFFALLFRVNFLEQLRSQATDRLEMEANSATARIESELRQLRSLSYQIEQSPDFISIRIQDPFTAIEAQRALFAANFINDLIEEVAYFPEGIRPVYSSQSPYTRSTYFRRVLGVDSEQEDRLESVIEQADGTALLAFDREDPSSPPLLLMVDALPHGQTGRRGVLVYSLSAAHLASQLDSVQQWSDAHALLRTSAGTLFSVGDLSDDSATNRLTEERSLTEFGLAIEFSVSQRALLAEFNRAILFLLGALALTLLLSLPLIYLFSSRHYRPIEQLGTFLERTFRVRPDARELSNVVEEQIQRLLHQRELLSGQIDASTHLVRRQLLVKMFQGNVHPKRRFLDLCREHGLDVERKAITVVMAWFDPPGQEDELATLERSLAEAMHQADVLGLVEIESGQVAVLVGFAEAGPDMGAALRAALDGLIRERDKQVALSAGSVVSEIELVSQSYLEARSALEHRFIRGMNQTFVFREILREEHLRYEYPVAQLSRLETLVRTIQPSRISGVLTEIFAEVRSQNPPLSVARMVSYDCANTMIRAAAQALPGRNAELWALTDALSLARVKTIDEAEEHMRSMSLTLCELLSEAESERADDSFAWVLRFIDQHAYELDFSAHAVADYCGRSLSSFSHLFRSQTGTTFRDYLQRLRMQRACELLRSTDAPVGNVVREVGYSDATSFIRKFKREFGLTPASFRKSERLERSFHSSGA
jgi:AraC-like DNA-binding protein